MAKNVANREDMSIGEWLLFRKRGIGGSDIAAIMGYSKWATPLSVYADKTTDAIDNEMSVAAEVGIELEPWLSKKLGQWLLDNEGIKVELEAEPYILQHDDHSFILANIDRKFIHPEKGQVGVELKTSGEWRKDEWKEGELPDAYYAQCQHYMGVTGWEWWYVAFLLGNRVFDVRLVPRNQEFIDRIVKACVLFWEEYVEPRIPPAPIGLEMDTDILRQLYPQEEADKTIDLSHMTDTYDRYKAMQETYKQLETDIDLIKQAFMSAMGDAELATVGEKRITWKTHHRKEYTKTYEAKDIRTFRIW